MDENPKQTTLESIMEEEKGEDHFVVLFYDSIYL